jgi:hypothetical protein
MGGAASKSTGPKRISSDPSQKREVLAERMEENEDFVRD